MDLDTNQLRTLAREDTPAATVHLIEHFYERIYAFLRRLAGNDADAADLTQRTFVRAQQALPSFAGHSSIASWVHSIAYHIYVDWRRIDRRTEARSDEWWTARACVDLTPAEAAAQTDFARALYAFVDRLEPGQRESIHLHYYQGLTLQETADAMEVAASTVKYRLRQALDELRRNLSTDAAASASTRGMKST